MSDIMRSIEVTNTIKQLAVKKAIECKLEKGCQILLAVDYDSDNNIDKCLYLMYLTTGQLIVSDYTKYHPFYISNEDGKLSDGNSYKMVCNSFLRN